MIHALLIAPVLVPLVTAILCLVLWQQVGAQRVVTLAGTGLNFALSGFLLLSVSRDGILVTHVGSWPAPFGISLVADLLSAIMVLLAATMSLAVAVYALTSINRAREDHGYHALYNILLMGVCGAFLTGDMFNLFVWFEVMLIASFVLIALGGERAQLDGATKYVTLNLLSSTLFLSAVGILYGLAGTLNMAHVAIRLSEVERPGLVLTVAMMFMGSFGIKAAMFPFFFWLPASYHTPPVVISAIFAGLLTKVGVYALIRTFTLIFSQDVAFSHTLLLVLSGLTMITGVLGAAAQSEFRRILSFHIVSQIGYMTMGLGLFSRLALAGSIFYIVHHIVVKTNLFLVSGIVERVRGTYELGKLGGLFRERPALSLLFLIPALSLAGMPPLSGFWAKLFLVKAGLELGEYAIVGVALLVGLFTMFSMTKIWNEAFLKKQPASEPAPAASDDVRARRLGPMFGPVVALSAVTLSIGFFAAPFFELALRCADQLLEPRRYISAVMEARR